VVKKLFRKREGERERGREGERERGRDGGREGESAGERESQSSCQGGCAGGEIRGTRIACNKAFFLTILRLLACNKAFFLTILRLRLRLRLLLLLTSSPAKLDAQWPHWCLAFHDEAAAEWDVLRLV
jgi:hypothetical protein